ncbi:uncharacterized protein [Dermacentor andersoni]|uniref:uncharacterized protein n=1 Tax=Dermacentor andersoni TaxID=34620 RepID=UPI002417B4A6|nr:mucin-2-like [Dermacentor andersoni]
MTGTPFPEEGVTTVPSAPTLITPFTEATIPWYSVGSTTLRTLKYSPSVTPEEGATFPETPFPGASTEYPTEFPLFPQQQATRPTLPAASIAATTEVGMPPEAASPSTGLVPAISQSVSPAQLPSVASMPHQEVSPASPPEVSVIPTTETSSPHGASFTPNEAVPSRPFGISIPETFPPGASVFPTTQMSLPSGVPSEEPSASIPTISNAATAPDTMTGGTPTSVAQKELTATPLGTSVVPTTEVSLPTGASGKPNFVPSVSMGPSVSDTVTAFPAVVTQKGIPATALPGVSLIPTGSVSFPSSMFSQPVTGIPSVTGGLSVPVMITGTPASFPHEEVNTSSPPGLSVAPTTEISFPSGVSGEPTLIIPTLSLGISVPETTGTPPTVAQKESTATIPSGMLTAPTSETSIPSFMTGPSTGVVPSFSPGVSFPGTYSVSRPPTYTEGTNIIPSAVPVTPTAKVSLPSTLQSQPTAFIPSMSESVSTPQAATGTQLPSRPYLTGTFPSGVSIIPTTEVSRPSPEQQLTTMVPSVSAGVSLVNTGISTLPTSPQKETTTPFSLGPSGLPTTEVSLPSGASGQPTAVVPSVSLGVSVPGTQTGSQPVLPYGEITTLFPSGPSGIPSMEVPTTGVPGQPTAIVPSVSVGVSVTETGESRPPPFPQEGFTTPFPTGPSGLPTTEVSIPSGIPIQQTGIVPSVPEAVSVPETQTSSPPSFPHGELTTPFPSGPSGIPNTEVPPLSGVTGQPTAIVPSVSVGVSVPETEGSSPPPFPQEGFTKPFPTGPSGLPTTEVSIPSGIPIQQTGIVPSVPGVSVPETQTSSPPSFPHGELTTPFPSGPSGIPNTEVTPLSGVTGQPTAIVPSVSVGVSVPETEGSSPPPFPQEGFTTPFPTGPSGLPTTEVSIPSGIPVQQTGIVPSVPEAVSVPETQTGRPPSFPHGELTTPIPSGPSGIPNTEVPPLSGVPGQPTAIVPSVSVGVTVPGTEGSRPPHFPQEGLTKPFPTGPSGLPTTEVSIPSGIPGQPTGIVPSVSVGVSVPETQTSSPPSFPHGELTTPFPSGPSGIPNTEVPPLSGVPGQPTAIVPSVSVGVSVPETEGSSPPPFPQEGFTTPFPTGPSGLPTTEAYQTRRYHHYLVFQVSLQLLFPLYQ